MRRKPTARFRVLQEKGGAKKGRPEGKLFLMAKWVGRMGGKARAGGEVGRGRERESRAIACDSLCRFLVLTYDSQTLNERGWKKFLLHKLKVVSLLLLPISY